jgi:hypothetical protein
MIFKTLFKSRVLALYLTLCACGTVTLALPRRLLPGDAVVPWAPQDNSSPHRRDGGGSASVQALRLITYFR